MDAKITEFYMSEYQNLAQAHFQTSQRITTFFQYALIILAMPLTLFGLLKDVTQLSNQDFVNYICLAISVVGFFVTMYLGQLRTETLMYARSVNTIRNYFYNLNRHDDYLKIKEYSILSTQKYKPKYWDGEQFIFIILTLGLIDTMYFGYALYSFWGAIWSFYTLSLLFLLFHILFYKVLTRCSDANSRFYKHYIGIDIDGVLNLHKEQFVKIYNMLVDSGEIQAPKITLEHIKTIPVQDGGYIKEDDANKVFYKAEYWRTMPTTNNAAQIIKNTLINKLGFKIHIFTSRDWKSKDFDIKGFNIKKETKNWLSKNSYSWNRIKFESGNYNHPIGLNGALYSNRFYLSAKRKIDIFIEDEPEKARRLSHICRYVLLINQPYNQEDENNPYPYNVIRVNTWNDIPKIVRDLI